MKVRAWVIRDKNGELYRSEYTVGRWTMSLNQALFFSRIPDSSQLRQGDKAVEVEIRTIEKKGKK